MLTTNNGQSTWLYSHDSKGLDIKKLLLRENGILKAIF
jgi:hypothetical protein